MSSPWHFGNTTVRNPLRIREGLSVLRDSPLNGNIIGKPKERLFADELERAGVIHITNRTRDYSDFGRKWRSCFSQLGFITHKFDRNLAATEIDGVIREVLDIEPIAGLDGHPYQITPNGLRMANATTVQEQQECMLRALLAYEIPSSIEPGNGDQAFNPFFFILQILNRLSILDNPLGLSMIEMAILETCRSHDVIEETVQRIVDYRLLRENAIGRVAKRRIDRQLLEELAANLTVNADSLRDYSDVNFRYPRLTGLVSYRRKRLILNENKLDIVQSILNRGPDLIGMENRNRYLLRLWKGAQLPTDNEITAINELIRYRNLLLHANITDIPELPDTRDVAELNQIRIQLEIRYQLYLERRFADNQRQLGQIEEIVAYLKKIDGQEIDTERYDCEIDDEPAFLEWAVWRAFLAINNLTNEPHEARRFRVDQDFFPLGCAPGNGPDLIFEFEDYVLIVEVTLTSSSRQEAAEGEPVRRHVASEKARVSQISNKPVYGLFIAKAIDNNTAETFRIGVWYTGDNVDFINIVPLTLRQFISMMEKYSTDAYHNRIFRQVLDSCLIPRNAHAPAWKREIKTVIDSFVAG